MNLINDTWVCIHKAHNQKDPVDSSSFDYNECSIKVFIFGEVKDNIEHVFEPPFWYFHIKVENTPII
jgi:hypothetical protein